MARWLEIFEGASKEQAQQFVAQRKEKGAPGCKHRIKMERRPARFGGGARDMWVVYSLCPGVG